jgi:beta-phosphoglucomutase-like phosphatase (HAD superfamily)/dTDP-glucose pyrophosphorylase
MKLIVFDLDGVLVDSKDLHYEALNRALEDHGYTPISRVDHVRVYDGLPTSLKLDRLGIPQEQRAAISRDKQVYTTELMKSRIHEDKKLVDLFTWLREGGHYIHVASNSIRSTVITTLELLGLSGLVDHVMSNEDVTHVKPNPEMYLRCMVRAGTGPRHTTVVEDSYFGREAAYQSGAHLLAVNYPSDLTKELVESFLSQTNPLRNKAWKDHKMNVLIPMAGAGSRFASAGYTFPKPLIEVQGKPMIQVVLENLKIDAHYVFVVQREHYEKYNMKHLLSMLSPGCDIVCTDGVTEGAACTTLLAKQFIDNNDQLLIANSDQWVEWDSSEFMYAMQGSNVGGGIVCFHSLHPKWSYVKENQLGHITEVAEKRVISDTATIGIYHWGKGSDYVKYAEEMIGADERVNGEFYVAPVYNRAIAAGLIVKKYMAKTFKGLGTPEDLNAFLTSGIKV